MILVEGYMDAIGVYAAGIREVVAVCGTALGNLQVRAIKRHITQQQAATGTVVLNFDPDAAWLPLRRESTSATSWWKVFGYACWKLQGGLDPDEYIQKNGLPAYAKES